MRALILGIFVLFSLSLAAFPAVSFAAAPDTCRCKGCGCKGGPGWRGPQGTCVSKALLTQVCGSPPGAPCKQEAAARVCFGRPFGGAAPKADTEAQ